MNLDTNGQSEVLKKMRNVRSLIRAYIEKMVHANFSTIQGTRADDEGNYDDTYYDAKERQDQIREILRIFDDEEDLNNYKSVQAYITAKATDVQWFPEEISKPIIDYISKQFNIEIKPNEGESPLYQGYVEWWANEYNIPLEKVRAHMPYEKFTVLIDTPNDLYDVMEELIN